jgi:methanogenic corrinoid protein MtbC1
MNSAAASSLSFAERLLALDRLGAEGMLVQFEGGQPFQLIEELIVPALEEIGRRWERGETALAQIYMSSRICEELMTRFLPLSSPERLKQPKLGIVLLDDYHALGKIMIMAALRVSGWNLHDYGSMTVSELVKQVLRDQPDILLISTLMLRSALQIKELKAQLTAAGSPVKIIVGGAPFRFDSELWLEVGADGTGNDAAEAVRAVTRCLEEISP